MARVRALDRGPPAGAQGMWDEAEVRRSHLRVRTLVNLRWLLLAGQALLLAIMGLVMSYELGTNWSVFADRTSPILGPLLGYEVLSAFFCALGREKANRTKAAQAANAASDSLK